MKSEIILSRDSGWGDYFVKYNIIVNGKEMERIKNGEKKIIKVSPGEIEIYLLIPRFWKSNKLKFSIKENEQICLNCKSNFRGFRIFLSFFYSVFLPHKWIVLGFDEE